MTRAIKGHFLIIDDDKELLELMRDYYGPRGFKVDLEDSALTPLSRFKAHPEEVDKYDIIICDLKMPDFDGLEFIRSMKGIAPHMPIILMTAHSSIELAVNAVKEGAYDFVNKPLNFSHLTVSIERAINLVEIRAENEALKQVVSRSLNFEGVIARSKSMLKIIEFSTRVARSNSNVLILGESGTGKEVIAKAIHLNSPRKNGPFIAINCSAIPENLLESELFGYTKGAFTGAQEKKIGLFEEANQGTIFLDEIGDLSMPLQAKLLRVLQERKIKRVGENQFRDIDVRILTATHKNLMREIQEKRFRQDLFFRLNVIRVELPPLRQRREDIPLLADFFLKRFCSQNKVQIRGFSREVQEFICGYSWPGNVRELENAVERAVVLCQGDTIQMEDLVMTEEYTQDLTSESAPTESMSSFASSMDRESSETFSENSNPHELMESFEKFSPSQASTPETLAREMMYPSALYGSSLPVVDGKITPALFQPLKLLDHHQLPTLNDLSLCYIEFVLERIGGVRERAAKVLDIDRKTLYRKIDEIQRHKNPEEENSTENQDSSLVAH